MKRLLVFTAVLAIALLTSTLVMAQPLAPSVPNLIDFQGKLTTAGGPPVADGPHAFIFRIYDAPAGPNLLWSEGPVIIVTTGGLFTHQLGSSAALPELLFIDDNPHYLEVEANGAIIAPRTQLISHPFSRVANALEAKNPGTGATMVRTEDVLYGLSTYSCDGTEAVRLWGCSYGEIFLYDDDATNDLTAMLGAVDFLGVGTGGYLYLGNDAGSNTIRLHGSGVGDASVELPVAAVSAIEMFNEPGLVASPVGPPAGVPVPGGFGPVFAGATLVAPAAGFAVIICEAQFSAAPGPPNGGLPCALTENGPIMATWSWDAGDADGITDQTQVRVITRPIPAAGPFTYTLFISQVPFTGSITAGLAKITVLYFPTAYGPFAFPGPGRPDEKEAEVSGAFNAEAERAAAIAANQARIESEMAAMKSEMEALKQRMDANKQGKQQAVEPNR